MKGLIIKDFKLLMMQKSFFVTLTIVAIFFGITTGSIFVIGFLTMICSMFALSTMNLIMAMHFYFHYRLQEKVMLLKSIFLQLCLVLYHLFYQQ